MPSCARGSWHPSVPGRNQPFLAFLRTCVVLGGFCSQTSLLSQASGRAALSRHCLCFGWRNREAGLSQHHVPAVPRGWHRQPSPVLHEPSWAPDPLGACREANLPPAVSSQILLSPCLSRDGVGWQWHAQAGCHHRITPPVGLGHAGVCLV